MRRHRKRGKKTALLLAVILFAQTMSVGVNNDYLWAKEGTDTELSDTEADNQVASTTEVMTVPEETDSFIESSIEETETESLMTGTEESTEEKTSELDQTEEEQVILCEGYKINTEILNSYAQTYVFSGGEDRCVAEWRDFYSAIATMTEGEDYLQGTFVYEAASKQEADLIAKIYNGELEGYAYGIATMHIGDYSTSEILEVCINTYEGGVTGLPAIYPDMLYTCDTISEDYNLSEVIDASPEVLNGDDELTDDDSEDVEDVDLQMAYGGYQGWSLSANNVYSAWNYSTGKGVRIAVLDTGVSSHRDVRCSARYNAFAKDYSNPENAMAHSGSYNDVEDNSGHGTALVGIITGKGGNNNTSIVGLAPNASVVSIKCMEEYNGRIWGDTATLIRAIEMAVESNCKIINISAAIQKDPGALLEKTIKEVTGNGAIVVCAAGDTGDTKTTWPAAYDNTLCITATKKDGVSQVIDGKYSCFNNYVDFAAPGTDIYCANPVSEEKYQMLSGTALSATMISSAIALYIERNPEYNRTDSIACTNGIREALQNAAIDLGSSGRDQSYGFGVIDFGVLVSDSNFDLTASPKISIGSGPVSEGYGIKLYSSNGNSTIYYTLDGTVPTKNSLRYISEYDSKGYIYLPKNMESVTLKAISIDSRDNKTGVVTANYSIVPELIEINENKYVYTGVLGKSGFFKNYTRIASSTKGKDMPYQLFTLKLNPGDSIDTSLSSSGFNAELHLIVDNLEKVYDVRPVTSSMVASKYARNIKYTNATTYVQNLVLVVTSGELLAGQLLANGSGKYTLTANVTRKMARLDMVLPNSYLIKGTSMTAVAKITPYDAVNKKVKWELYDKYGNEADKKLIAIDGNGKITVKTDVTAPVDYKVRVTSVENSSLYAVKLFKVYPAVKKIEIIDDVVDLTANGKQRTYNAAANFAVTPGNSLGQYTYSSSNPKVATVTDKGVVTAVGKGTAKIIITAADGSKKSGKFTVNVNMIATSIALSPSTQVKPVGIYYPVYAGSTINIDTIIKPENVSSKEVSYSFSGTIPDGVTLKNNAVKIDATAKNNTVFNVKAECEDGSGVNNIIRFKVYAKPKTIKLSQEKVDLDTIKNKKMTILATVYAADESTEGILQKVTWSSSDEKVATVSEFGEITAIGKGNATIKATSTEGANVFALCKVHVASGVTSIAITTANSPQDPSAAQPVVSGKNTVLKAICYPADADNQNVEWTLKSAPEGVTFENGVIYVPPKVTSGSVIVVATAKDGYGAVKTRAFNIYKSAVTKVVISAPSTTLNTVSAKTCALTAQVSPSYNTFGGVVWKSSDERVATVNSSGVVTAIGKGSVTIYAYAKDGYGAKASIRLKVIQPMTSFSIENSNRLKTIDGKILLKTGVNRVVIRDIKPVTASDKKVTWSLIGTTDGVTIDPNTGSIKVSSDLANRITNLTIRATVRSSGAYFDMPAEVYPATVKVCLSSADSKIKLTIGSTHKLLPTTFPTHAYNSYSAHPFEYVSTNPNVATVSSTGVVTAVSKGTAKILIKSTDGTKKRATAVVKVY